jgi:hypothetical protein
MNAETAVQQRVVDALVNKWWLVTHADDDFVYVAKRTRTGSFYAQVDREGDVHGHDDAVKVGKGVRR